MTHAARGYPWWTVLGACLRYAAAVRPLQVYAYAKCTTCRKALRWLEEHGLDHEVIDIVTSPPSEATLRNVLREGEIPVKKLFNTSGQSYREGRFSERITQMSEGEALAALARDGKLIKRPLVIGQGVALVGFRSHDYERAMQAPEREA
jgi:arsenate reductase